jgi:sulfopyruvate decarboxylase subunit beta
MNFRHEYLSALVKELRHEIIVTNTGGTQHELFTLGDRDANLYAAGIGLVSQVALGLAIALPKRKIIALDGDGSLLLNLGILPVLAQQTPKNLLVMVFDNGLYESGGNTATLSASGADLAAIAKGAGVTNPKTIDSLDGFIQIFKPALQGSAFDFLVIRVKPGGLPVTPKGMSGVENKFRFIRYIEATEGKRIFSTPVRTSQKPSS